MSDVKDTNIFNVNNIISFSSETKNESLIFGAFNGKMKITVFKGRQPLTLIIDPTFYGIIKQKIVKLRKDTPGARYPMQISKYNFNTKKSELKYTFTIGKNDSGIYYFEVMEPNSPPMVFPIKGSGDYSNGGERMPAPERSEAAMMFVSELFSGGLFMASLLTRNDLRTNAPGGNKNSNNGGGNNYNQNNYSNNSSSDDDFD